MNFQSLAENPITFLLSELFNFWALKYLCQQSHPITWECHTP